MRPPHIHQTPDDLTIWELVSPHTVDILGVPYTVGTPFFSDLGSIPRLFWTLLGITPADISISAIPHDDMCRRIKLGVPGAYERRKLADSAFLFLLVSNPKIWCWQRWGCYLGLRFWAITGLWKGDCSNGVTDVPFRMVKKAEKAAKKKRKERSK